MSDQQHLGRQIREWRRLRAVKLYRMGWREVDIAAALDVNRGTVSHWLTTAQAQGTEALRAPVAVGHPPKLTAEQLRRIPEFLSYGAEAYGFRGDVWTCPRIVQMIEMEFGVHYHKDHVSRLMKDLGWTPQVPNTRTIQTDEAVIERWRLETWPELRRQASEERRTLVFVDESGFYLLPGIVRT